MVPSLCPMCACACDEWACHDVCEGQSVCACTNELAMTCVWRSECVCTLKWACHDMRVKVRGQPHWLMLTSHLGWDRVFWRFSCSHGSSLQWNAGITAEACCHVWLRHGFFLRTQTQSIMLMYQVTPRVVSPDTQVPFLLGIITPTENNPNCELINTRMQRFVL